MQRIFNWVRTADWKKAALGAGAVCASAAALISGAGLIDTLDLVNLPRSAAGLESAFRGSAQLGFGWVDGALALVDLPYAIWAKPAALFLATAGLAGYSLRALFARRADLSGTLSLSDNLAGDLARLRSLITRD